MAPLRLAAIRAASSLKQAPGADNHRSRTADSLASVRALGAYVEARAKVAA